MYFSYYAECVQNPQLKSNCRISCHIVLLPLHSLCHNAQASPCLGAEANSHGFLVAQMEKNLPAVQETWVQSLSQEDPLEKAMATHSSILAWKIPWTEEPGGLQSIGSQRAGCDRATNTCLLKSLFFVPDELIPMLIERSHTPSP